MGNYLAKDSRHNVVYTDSEVEDTYFENEYVLGQVLPDDYHSGEMPLDADEMDANPRYTTYMVLKEDQTLQVALFSGVIFVDEDLVGMIFHPMNMEFVHVDNIRYPAEHILLPPEGYSWKHEPGKTRVSISNIRRHHGY